MSFTCYPPAKINLGLWLQGRLPNGFHELVTIFHEIPLCDKIVLEKSSQRELVCPNFSNQENLVWKAWDLLEKTTHRSLPAQITLEKKIPDQAGLGGGSSDASWTLKALDRFFDLNLDAQQLHSLASQLGSDTAFFINGGCQLGEGRGEKLKPIAHQISGYLLLGVPAFKLSTQKVFQALPDRLTPNQAPANMIVSALEERKLEVLNEILKNDLLTPALTLEPQLESFMSFLRSLANNPIHLSGSGSSCFALTSEPIDSPGSFEGRLLTLIDMSKKKILWELS